MSPFFPLGLFSALIALLPQISISSRVGGIITPRGTDTFFYCPRFFWNNWLLSPLAFSFDLPPRPASVFFPSSEPGNPFFSYPLAPPFPSSYDSCDLVGLCPNLFISPFLMRPSRMKMRLSFPIMEFSSSYPSTLFLPGEYFGLFRRVVTSGTHFVEKTSATSGVFCANFTFFPPISP